MNDIKNLLIKIKNTSNANKYDMTLILKQLQDIYIERLFAKFFGKKETIDILNEQKNLFNKYKKYYTRQEKLSNFIDKWQTKDNYFLKTGLTIFIINLLAHIYFITDIGMGLLYSFLSSGLSCCLFTLFFLGVDAVLDSKIKKIEKEFSEKYDVYIKNNYKDLYSKISLDLINEIDAVEDLELNKFKKDLKEHIIKHTHNINQDEQYILSVEDLYIINQVENKIFKEKTKPIDNKILTKENNETVEVLKKEREENLDLNDMLKNLQTKFEDKIL